VIVTVLALAHLAVTSVSAAFFPLARGRARFT
jgi:hypothetical protein